MLTHPSKHDILFIFLKIPFRKSFLKNFARAASRACACLYQISPVSSGHFVMNTVRVSTII